MVFKLYTTESVSSRDTNWCTYVCVQGNEMIAFLQTKYLPSINIPQETAQVRVFLPL